MNKNFRLLFILFLVSLKAVGQFAPQAGIPGSTALSAASPLFRGWAIQCNLNRGFMDIANPSLGYASAGDSSLAIGIADDQTVSLGDSGVADLTFEFPIANGPGADFAVFENGFLNPGNDSQAFLELGFVEVSSDGVHYFRFPATSLTQDSIQATNNTYLCANNMNNLAGNYIAMFGTPFDLQELTGIEGLEINNITHVRVIDVVGSLSGHVSHDNSGRIINDPYPTPYPSCGFDLDAVGVVNQAGNAGVKNVAGNLSVNTFPNPVTDELLIAIKGTVPEELTARLKDITGKVVRQMLISRNLTELNMEDLAAGLYILDLQDQNTDQWAGKIIKH